MQLGRVFISSVFGGMLDLRETAAEAAKLVGLDPVLTERLVAQPGSVRAALEHEIKACDTYVGLFDRRRGTVPPGKEDEDAPRAITEEEFALAREHGLRCLVFLSRAAAADREPGLNDFLDSEVTEYRHGLWTRFYEDESALRREIAADLAALRPRVVLSLTPAPGGYTARLFLRDVAPVWTKETELGPVPAHLELAPTSRVTLAAFRRGAEDRGSLPEGFLRILGLELGLAALPGGLAKALAEVLDHAAAAGRLVTLEVRTADPEALALPWELISVTGHLLPVREGLLEVVRRIPGPGETGNPLEDTAPTLPAGHLSVLGFTAAPLDDEAPQVRLGAEGGLHDSSDLFWEQEQERLLLAFETLLRERRGRLILPDTGEKEDLRLRLSHPDRPQVVHVSCHGGSLQEKDGDPEPVLFLEDADGQRAPLQAGELLAWTHSAPGSAPDVALLVLSACSTAGAVGKNDYVSGFRAAGEPVVEPKKDVATGLAETLVKRGLLRVLGMQSTVSDTGATAFAEKLYARLADGADLSSALRAGRVELAAKGLPHEWAVPTLTLRCDTGPLVAPRGSAAPVEHPFEAARGAFDVAGISYLEEGYVGSRETERCLRRAFEQDRLLAIHGLGGIGKSTLAARFLERRQAEGWRVLIIYAGRELTSATVFEEVAAKLGLARPAGVPSEQAEALLQQAMKEALRAGPTVLFLDDFEDNQDGDGRLKDPALGEALLDLALLGGPSFRMLFTSRHRVHLGPGTLKVRAINLGGLTPFGCRKLRALPRFAELGKLPEEAWQRALFHFGGHPKALELLEGFLREQPDRARQLLADMGPAVAAVDEDLRAKRQDKGRALLVDKVLEAVPEEHRPSFERLCLLDAPLPTEELETLLTGEGIANPSADLAWLRDHGFLARTVAPSALTGGDAVHRLLANRQEKALADREGEEVVRAWHLRVAEHLVNRRGPLSDYGIAARHRDAAGDRAGALELFDRWAIALRNQHAYAACLQIAQEGLQSYPAGEVESERVGAARLRIREHDALNPLGRIEEAVRALETASELVGGNFSPEAKFLQAGIQMLQGRLLAQAGRPQGAVEKFESACAGFKQGGHFKERAVALGDVARLRAQAGDMAAALKLHEESLAIFEQLGDVRSRTVTLGDVARLRAQAGDVAGALKLHEESLAIFEQLGDVRSRAVTLGDVARLRAQAGDVAGALKLHEESLAIFEQLGDVRSRAVTLGDVARLRAQAGDVAGALKLHEERLVIFEQLGDVRSRAVTLGDVARLRAQAGDVAGALKLHEESLAIFEQLGDQRSRAITLGDLALLRTQAGDVAGALKLHEEELRTYEQLGDVRSRAITLGDVARLRAQAGDVAGALKLHEESLAIFEQLGDVRSRTVTLGDVARLRSQAGDVAGALKLHEESLAIFEQLGDVRSRAVILGDLARLRAQAGNVNEALKLHEERLAIFEQLGDVRSRAVTLSDLARIQAMSGDIEGALRLQVEGLEINRRLGDIGGIAAAQYDIAALKLERGEEDEAVELLAESWNLNCRTGRADGIAFVGALYGRLLAANHNPQAISILRTSQEAFSLLGIPDQAARIEKEIQIILESKPGLS